MLVAGSTGGVGQLVTAKLLEVRGAALLSDEGSEGRVLQPRPPAPMPSSHHQLLPSITPHERQKSHHHHHHHHRQRGYRVRALTRRASKATELFGAHPNLEPAEGDCRDKASLARAVQGVDAICCCTGTTAFPSKRCA